MPNRSSERPVHEPNIEGVKIKMSRINRLQPQEARDALENQAHGILVDVRDPVEFRFVGHPPNAVNVPWLLFAPESRPNPGFLEHVRTLAPDASTPLFLMCRSGQRSLAAAAALEQAGYTNLVNIEDGFEGSVDEHGHRSTLGGWRFHGLPWIQG